MLITCKVLFADFSFRHARLWLALRKSSSVRNRWTTPCVCWITLFGECMGAGSPCCHTTQDRDGSVKFCSQGIQSVVYQLTAITFEQWMHMPEFKTKDAQDGQKRGVKLQSYIQKNIPSWVPTTWHEYTPIGLKYITYFKDKRTNV